MKKARTVIRAPDTFDPDETIWGQWSAAKALRRRLASLVYRIPDSGLLGLKPLRTHVHVVGYPRAGTTLMLMMLEHAYPRARRFGREMSGWRAATFQWRNHEVVISKRPLDIFRLAGLRNFYRGRRSRLRTILMVRDPRDAMTSRHEETGRDVYFQDLEQWRDIQRFVDVHRREPDVLLLKYEDLVSDPDAVQARIDAFTGEKSERRYADAYRHQKPGFYVAPLNGVRPVDQRGIGRWADPQHRQHIEQVLREIPDLPQILIGLGYEPDHRWLETWRIAGASALECPA